MKNKQLRKWALWAEIMSAVAVVVTIGFLAFQMMANTNALQAQTFQELMRDINDWRSSIRELEGDSTLIRLRKEGIDSLSEGEQGVVRLAYLELWGIYEAAFYANERGVLGPEEWIRFEVSICRSRRGQVDVYWDWDYEGLSPFNEILTPLFVKYVENLCQ